MHFTKKNRIFLALFLIFSVVIIFLAEFFSRKPYERALDAVGAGNIRRQGNYSWEGFNHHGSIFMDGTSYFCYHLSDKKQLESVSQKEGWHSFPIDERISNEINRILWNMESDIPESERTNIVAELGQIRNGGWFFYDKGDVESLKNMDLDWTYHHGRRPTNYIIAVSDFDTGTLYYFDSDL